MRRLLIAGFGDLGQRLLARLEGQEHWQVHALRRSAVESSGPLIVHRADLTRADSLVDLPERFDAIIYQATPSERTASAYRDIYLRGMQNLLATTSFGHFIMVSSTAVYGQDQGQWVDERSDTAPTAFNGQILLEAERLALAAGGRVVRFSGIYGPGRDALLNRLRSGETGLSAQGTQWTNRIHSDDAAAVLAHLLNQPEWGPVICASDNRPSPRSEVVLWLAAQMRLPPPCDEASTAFWSASGKRLSNHRLRASGFEFTYPDFQSGYKEVFEPTYQGTLK